ncbi:MAG: hypothetical protein MZV65_15495 [Chromatiales bacterium]|nr:hypothetical protein [Chromatiales bacterium]
MDLIAERVEVWAASIEDKPGSLATILAGLREAGADLNFILARREPDQPGQSVVYVTPLTRRRRTRSRRHPGLQPDRARAFGAGRRPEPAGDCRRPGRSTGGSGPQPARVSRRRCSGRDLSCISG